MLIAAGSAWACTPGIEFITEYSWQATSPISVFVLPGDPGATKAYATGGLPVDPTLSLRILDVAGQPFGSLTISGESVLIFYGGPVVICEWAYEDLTTDGEGWLTLPLSGGGYRGPGGPAVFEIFVNVCPNQLLSLPDDVYFNSPDINGDLRVNLTDVPLFAEDFYGQYAYRSDFNWDNQVNLSDVVTMAVALGADCP
ncbi:MAG: hypothetical protein ACI9UK_000566 [Candidatus Krumholzibacteriia bacterium]|jgi:hypothetical protein